MRGGWLLRLAEAERVHEPMPSIEQVFTDPTDGDHDHFLPLVRLELSELETNPNWPAVAYVLAYTLLDYSSMIENGNGWATFRLNDDGRLRHEIPDAAFLDQPVLTERDRDAISAGTDDPEVERFWFDLRRKPGRVVYPHVDEELGLEPGTTKARFDAYERGRLALGRGIEAIPVDIPDDDIAAYEFWRSEVENKLGVGVISEKPTWIDPAHHTPQDTAGKPMIYLGQFNAVGLTTYVPMFVYWLYWSPTTRTFTQIDDHD